MPPLTPAALRILLVTVVLGLLGLAIGYAIHLHDEAQIEIGRKEVRAQWDAAKSQAEAEQEKIEAQRLQREKEAQDAYTQELSRAAADAAGANAAAGRLRQQLAVYLAAGSAPGSDHAAAGQRPGDQGGAPRPVLSDVFGRLDDAAGQLARYADDLHAAGTQCEGAHDALTP